MGTPLILAAVCFLFSAIHWNGAHVQGADRGVDWCSWGSYSSTHKNWLQILQFLMHPQDWQLWLRMISFCPVIGIALLLNSWADFSLKPGTEKGTRYEPSNNLPMSDSIYRWTRAYGDILFCYITNILLMDGRLGQARISESPHFRGFSKYSSRVGRWAKCFGLSLAITFWLYIRSC